MSVTRYRDASEMPPPPRVPDDDDLAARIRRIWHCAVTLCPLDPPRGVQRFRTMEEAGRARDEEIVRRMIGMRTAGGALPEVPATRNS